MSTKNTRYLQTSTKRLVKEHTCLEFRNKRKPRKKRNWCEQKETHHYLITSCKCLHRSPESS
ncbi:hypothetical protein Hanom_Chr07g00659371 [Helianthus anomalus]